MAINGVAAFHCGRFGNCLSVSSGSVVACVEVLGRGGYDDTGCVGLAVYIIGHHGYMLLGSR